MQSTHAAVNFVFENPDRAGPWFKNSNYLIEKVAPTEEDLYNLAQKCKEKGIVHTVFRESDLDNQITAIALEPSELTERLVRKLPLLFQKQKS